MQSQPPADKRSLLNLRRLIEEAPAVQKATLRYMARMLGVEKLQKLDDTLGRLDSGKENESKP